MKNPIRANGFTNEVLGWKAWLKVLDLKQATPEQIAVLEESHPKAKTMDYYLLLAHQPEILHHRSQTYNEIMYAPEGLSRAERELGALTVSQINGCVYCASVHSQRFVMASKRPELVQPIFENPRTAAETARDAAIIDLAIALTEQPGTLNPQYIENLKATGLDELEILDLIQAVSIFGWANRLMLNLGEAILPE